MKNTKLYFKAVDKLGLQVPEELIFQAYFWAEGKVNLLIVKNEYDDLLEKDKLSPVLEDYILAVLSERAKPLERRYVPWKTKSGLNT